MDDPTVLFVDDEAGILGALKRLTRGEPYRVLTAQSGREALAALDAERVDLVVTDQRMPEMTGTELLQKVKERSPETLRVILSGYADAASIVEAINRGEVFRFLTKPWNDSELKAAIRQCLELGSLARQKQEMAIKIEALNALLSKDLAERSQFLRMYQEVVSKLPIPGRPVDADPDRKNRILAVDDDLRIANMIRLQLEKEGFQVEVATDGFKAGALLGSFAPSVVTLDLAMPGIGGQEVIRFIRGIAQFSSIKILVVSALSPERLQEALALGADEALAKPFTVADLVSQVQKLSEQFEASPTPDRNA